MWSLFSSPWVTFRRAAEALKAGRPEDARQLIEPLAEQGYRKAVKMMREVVRGYLDRAERCLRADDIDCAWADLLAAESLAPAGDEPRTASLRKLLTKDGLNEVAAALEAANPRHAMRTLGVLHDRGVGTPWYRQLHQVSVAWLAAAELADKGKFDEALAALTAVVSRLESVRGRGLRRYEQELTVRRSRYAALLPTLMSAAQRQDWKVVVEQADEVLAAAPNDPRIRELRSQAWGELVPGLREQSALRRPSSHGDHLVPLIVGGAVGGAAALGAIQSFHVRPTLDYQQNETPKESCAVNGHGSAEFTLPETAPMPTQFLLWVDGVGGYLVCLNAKVTIGQATAETPTDIRLFAPIASLHAEIHRDEAGHYVLQPSRDTYLNDEPATKAVLKCGDRIALGSACRLVFRKPSALSSTAQLDVVSGHRQPWAVNGILLMDRTLILGTGGDAHVALPPFALEDDEDYEDVRILLHGTETGLALKCPGRFKVDNRPHEDKAPLPLPAGIVTPHYAFSVEPIGPRL